MSRENSAKSDASGQSLSLSSVSEGSALAEVAAAAAATTEAAEPEAAAEPDEDRDEPGARRDDDAGGFGRDSGLRKPLRKSRSGCWNVAPVRVSMSGTSRWPHMLENPSGVHFSLRRLPMPAADGLANGPRGEEASLVVRIVKPHAYRLRVTLARGPRGDTRTRKRCRRDRSDGGVPTARPANLDVSSLADVGSGAGFGCGDDDGGGLALPLLDLQATGVTAMAEAPFDFFAVPAGGVIAGSSAIAEAGGGVTAVGAVPPHERLALRSEGQVFAARRACTRRVRAAARAAAVRPAAPPHLLPSAAAAVAVAVVAAAVQRRAVDHTCGDGAGRGRPSMSL